MTSFGGLATRLRQLAVGVNANSQKAVRQVSQAVGYEVIEATPIDTSRAKYNWQSSVGLPKIGVLLAYPAAPSSPAEGSSIARASVDAATISYRGQVGGVWIVNNLPYIGLLNNGSSAQAPADFVARAVLAGVRSISTVRLLPP